MNRIINRMNRSTASDFSARGEKFGAIVFFIVHPVNERRTSIPQVEIDFLDGCCDGARRTSAGIYSIHVQTLKKDK